jgi:hypothetical protein
MELSYSGSKKIQRHVGASLKTVGTSCLCIDWIEFSVPYEVQENSLTS